MDHLRRSSLNFFAAAVLDRAGPRRLDHAWLAERLRDRGTRVVPVWRLRNLLRRAEAIEPLLLAPAELGDFDLGEAIFLGEGPAGAVFALDLPLSETDLGAWLPAGAEAHELRDTGPWLDPGDGATLAYARALVHWHRQHRHCGACGQPTRARDGGHMRECTAPGCGQRHFPRTDPAVIVLVASPEPDPADQRCLLGSQQGWPPELYSTIAGFVEPGETLEHAVVREVFEETGIGIDAVHYHSSQPWPFPSSLMLGYLARAADETVTRHDGELRDARWFTREAIAGGIAAGRLKVPRRVSIAYRLLEDWFDRGRLGPLAEVVAGVSGVSPDVTRPPP